MATGIETTGDVCQTKETGANARIISIPDVHQRLIQVTLYDTTDRYNQLVLTREWLLHGKDTEDLTLTGNLFAVESPLTGSGKVFVKCAPLSWVRQPEGNPVDIAVRSRKGGGFEYSLHQTGPEDLEYWEVIDYTGGVTGRTRALHNWEQSLRPDSVLHRTPRFISNTWGDRNRDACINHDFIRKEIEHGARLGVDVIQIDDGWQKGRTANSSEAQEKGGVWTGFREADPEFWLPDPDRFPDGLLPLIEYASTQGVELGLWYAPDSHNEFGNWREDADHILKLHRELGVHHFKLDSITTETTESRRNLRAMITAIVEESGGEVVCDLDITAGVRPGYFGEMTLGPLFLENRYTDWHNYWPHFTLRNLWQLSHWINPRRLRMEFLNNARNQNKYEGDPLAPALYPPATLFAITMFANPLGWFENSGLSNEYVAEVAPLVAVWKEHREAIFDGDIIPIGNAPDGVSWTGFCSFNEEQNGGYAVLFNENSHNTSHTFSLSQTFREARILSGEGSVQVSDNELTAEIDSPFGYLFLSLE